MKKKLLDAKKKNSLAIALYFLAGLTTLNMLGDSITAHSLGIAFLIAGIYGLVCVSKDCKFLF